MLDCVRSTAFGTLDAKLQKAAGRGRGIAAWPCKINLLATLFAIGMNISRSAAGCGHNADI
jgi:hypothetical protein